MAPFLVNQISFLSWLGNILVDIGFLSAFRGLDELAGQLRDDQPRVRRAYECS